MDVTTFALAAGGLFLAGVIKGATGLGYASCALPFLVLAIGLKPAMALVLAPTIATNLSLILTTGFLRETISKYRVMYVAMLPGIACGIYLLVWVDQAVAVKVLGGVILFYVALTLLRPKMSLSGAWQKTLQAPAGFLNGIFTGLTGSQVVPLLPYVMSLKLDPARTVQAINIGVTIGTVLLAAGLFAAGILTYALAAASLVAILPALGGTALGVKLRELASVEQFRLMVLLTLLAIGLLMLFR